MLEGIGVWFKAIGVGATYPRGQQGIAAHVGPNIHKVVAGAEQVEHKSHFGKLVQARIQVATDAQPIALKPESGAANPGNHQGLGLYPGADLPIGIMQQGIQGRSARQWVFEQVIEGGAEGQK